MSENSIETVVGEYITALTGTSVKPIPESTLESIGVDSISLVKILVFIEKKFGVSLVDSGVSRENLETFGKLTDFIRSLSES
ncbi:MAG: acyl carrier protein [Kiritimatiellaeota bacterium]|nr:acyl carrier protein [Kiritimatiellota bacterium]